MSSIGYDGWREQVVNLAIIKAVKEELQDEKLCLYKGSEQKGQG